MYRSEVDAAPNELAFEFDPLRPLHAHDGSQLSWSEYPYKQILIDKLCAKFAKPKLGQDAAAGALLIARGDLSRAIFEIEQHFDQDCPGDECFGNRGWQALVERFTLERGAFRTAKREFIKTEKMNVGSKLQAVADLKQAEADRAAHEEWKRRQIIKRYENGNKYDGGGVYVDDVAVPHGHGTLWVPQSESQGVGDIGDIKRIPQYIGEWKDGMMHGKGTYYWRDGASWEGNFCRDELQGRGVFTTGLGDDGDPLDLDTARQAALREQRVRYFDCSQHVCWGDELGRGCRLRVLSNRLYGHPLSSVIARENVTIDEAEEWTIIDYDASRDQYRVRKGESEKIKWISLANVSFRVAPSRPITRFES